MSLLALSPARTAGLARWNAALLIRNRSAFAYAVVFPLLPLALLFSGDPGDRSVGASAVTTAFLVAALSPVYYNVLSQFVSRRDELVLKRMRTGEATDGELLLSIALPGAICALAVLAATVPIAFAADQPLPLNPAVYAAAAGLAVIMFTAFALWTAAWTRSAEAAQLTSMPIIFLVFLGPVTASLPSLSDGVRDVLSFTPGAAITELIRTGWFGLDGVGAHEATLQVADTWGAAGGPLLVMAAWTAVGFSLARRSLRWEPRA